MDPANRPINRSRHAASTLHSHCDIVSPGYSLFFTSGEIDVSPNLARGWSCPPSRAPTRISMSDRHQSDGEPVTEWLYQSRNRSAEQISYKRASPNKSARYPPRITDEDILQIFHIVVSYEKDTPGNYTNRISGLFLFLFSSYSRLSLLE